MEIDSQTKLTGIIGFPLEYTLSPAIFNAVYQQMGMNCCYVSLPVPPADLAGALNGLKVVGFKGVNVTMPHKEAVLSLLDELDESAAKAGAVNTIYFDEGRSFGYNTDGQGFLNAFSDEFSFQPSGRNVLIIGAGGAARAIAVSLALAGTSEMTVVNRTQERARSLAELVKRNVPGCRIAVASLGVDMTDLLKKTDLIINATSVGMGDEADRVPIDIDLINDKHYVFDLIYDPDETLFLKGARERGARTANGLKMLVHQAAIAFKIWTGLDMPVEAVLARLQHKQIGLVDSQ